MTMSASTVIWLLSGYSGLFLIQNLNAAPPSNLLDAFSDKDVVANIGRMFMSLNILVSLPYSSFMPRLALLSIFKLTFGTRINESAFHIVATVCIMVSATMVG